MVIHVGPRSASMGNLPPSGAARVRRGRLVPVRCARLLASAALAAAGGRADQLAGVDERLAAPIRAAQVGAVVQLTPLTMAVALLNAGCVVLVFWPAGPRWLLAVWFGLVCVFAVMALRTWCKGRRRPSPSSVTRRGLDRVVAHATLLAGAWALAPAALFPAADPFGRFVLGCLASGMIAGSAFALSAVPRAGLAYTWTFSLLTAAGMAASGDPRLLAAAAMLCLYAGLISRNIVAHGALLVETLLGRREIEAQREVLGLLLRDFEESANDCLWETDAAGRLRRAPPRLAEALGLAAAQAEGAGLADLLDRGTSADARHGELAARLAARLAFRDVLATVGERIWGFTARPVHGEAGAFAGFRGVASDVTDRVRAERRARFLAHHDPLTGLPNRAHLREALTAALARARRDGTQVGVLALDLDRFKEVNDTLGHAAGDALLRAVASRLRAATREEDAVARLGGDEFVVVQVGVEQPGGAAELAERLVRALAEPYDLDGHRALAGGSVGVAVAPADGGDAEVLLGRADAALYRAKAEGRGAARFFEPRMEAVLKARREMERDLRQAVAEGTFELHYQPLYDLPGGALAGFEALLRWTRPGHGPVPPAEFVPLAEETGLIVPIGAWALRAACRAAASWPDRVKVAVNLSPVQFRGGGLVATVRGVLAETGLAPGRLELEITEGLLLGDTDAVLGTLHDLRSLGVGIAMDDFGTGYSSLAYLWRFPFSKLKIDRSFVAGMGANPKAAAIVETVVGLGRSLGLDIVAEGVETEAEASALRDLGCGLGQGYLLGRPMQAEQARRLAAGSTEGAALMGAADGEDAKDA